MRRTPGLGRWNGIDPLAENYHSTRKSPEINVPQGSLWFYNRSLHGSVENYLGMYGPIRFKIGGGGGNITMPTNTVPKAYMSIFFKFIASGMTPEEALEEIQKKMDEVAGLNHTMHLISSKISTSNDPPEKIIGLRLTNKGYVLLIQYETPAGYFVVEKYIGLEQVVIKGKVAEISLNASNGKYEGNTIELNIGTGKIGMDYTEVSIGQSFKGFSVDAVFGVRRGSLDFRYTDKNGNFSGSKLHFIPSAKLFLNSLEFWARLFNKFPIMPMPLPIPISTP